MVPFGTKRRVVTVFWWPTGPSVGDLLNGLKIWSFNLDVLFKIGTGLLAYYRRRPVQDDVKAKTFR
jgi:hypothetical protein